MLFDTDALAMLERFERKQMISLDDIADLARTPIGWTKVGLLMQAYFIEVIGLDMRITSEGRQALARLDEYLTALESLETDDEQEG